MAALPARTPSGTGADSRWLFIIDAIITLPIAVAGFFLYPNLPLQGKKTWWLTDEEFQLSRDRLNNIGRAGKTPWSWAKVRRLASSWHTWILRELRREPLRHILAARRKPLAPTTAWPRPGERQLLMIAILYVLWNNGWPQNPLPYYLKSFNAKPAPVPGHSYSVPQINTRESTLADHIVHEFHGEPR